ncbi:MAG: transporter [Planctomycetaceae bacterium]|nr:transporter [Planctomycetaceae bacterium]
MDRARSLFAWMLAALMVSAGSGVAGDGLFPPGDNWLTFAAGESSTPSVRLVDFPANDSGTLFLWPGDAKPEGGPPGPDEPLASDRPDFTEASCTVGAGVLQIEMGYTVFYDDDGVTRAVAHSFPETLYRIGILEDWLELRIGWNYGAESETVGGISTNASGSQDLYLGVKLGLTPQQGWLPEMSLVPQMTVPLGSPLTNDRVLPGANWLYGWDINDWLSAGGSTQANLRVDDLTDDTYTEFAQSFTFGYTLTERLGAYTEWFMLSPIQADSAPTEHYLDAGLTFRVTNDLQLDVRVGKGVSGASVDFFSGAGAVVRF